MTEPTGTKIIGTEALDRNGLSANVRWQKGTAKVHDDASSWGVCFAMTAMWIKEALCGFGAEVSARQLGQHKQRICICQGVFSNAWGRTGGTGKLRSNNEAMAVEKKVLAQFGLKVIGGVRTHTSAEEDKATRNEVKDIENTIQKVGMYSLFSISSDTCAHTIGMYMSVDKSSYYFDPNFGLYKYSDMDTMMAAFTTHFSATYGDMNEGRAHMLMLD